MKKIILYHQQINRLFHPGVILFFFLLSSFSFLPFSTYSQGCITPQMEAILDANNIRAFFKTTNTHFFNGASAQFVVPKDSGKTTMFAASLWLGGLDGENKLHLSAMQYGQTGSDYWTGPVSTAGQQAGSYYDRFWTITKAEIDYHKAHYTDPEYAANLPESITQWPAHGRAEYEESTFLAPYKSVSGNSKYTPEQGDYPLIRGDKAIFWMNNDVCGPHSESQGEPLGVEMMCMAYAYNSSEYALEHTIFITYEIRNKSTNNYKDFYVGFFADFDIGNGWDDYIGCDSALNLAYGYNGFEIDGGEPWAYGEHPPAQGAMFLNQKMSAFMYFNNSPTVPTGGPTNTQEYYNYLQAKWRNGIPLTLGGTGYNPNSTNYTNYAFNGDPVAQTGWTESTPNGTGSTPNSPGDRRGLLSAGPFTLNAGKKICFDIALPFARDLEGDNISAVAMLKQNVQTVQQFYNNQNYTMACDGNVNIKENNGNSWNIKIYPNPSQGQFVVSCDKMIERIEFYDVLGKKVFESTPKANAIQLNTQLPEGFYIYRALLQDSSISSGKVVVQ